MTHMPGVFEAWISFERPWWLLLIPLAIAGALIPVLRRRATLTQLQWTYLALRALVVVAAVGALADPQWTWTTRALAVVLVRDVSDSIPQASEQALDRHLALVARPDGAGSESIGEVTVGANAVLRERPSGAPLPPASSAGVDRSGTDLASGVLLAAALAAPDAGLRVVLASDGNETSGSLAAAARSLRARSIPIDVLPLRADRDPWAIVSAFRAPMHARPGTTIDARVELESSRPLTGRLLVRGGEGDDATGIAVPVELTGGRDVVALRLPVGDRAIERYDVRFESDVALDVDPRALRATALTMVDGPARTLVIAEGGDPTPLVEALGVDDLAVDRCAPGAAPLTVEGWSGYDLVVLAGVSAESLGRTRQMQLRSYVEDLGGGVIVTAGRLGFARDWLETPLEPMLPVDLRLPESRMPSRGAVALVIDRSGSMSASVGATGRSQESFAHDASIAALTALSRQDLVSVIAFDGMATTVVPLRRNDDAETIARQIRSIEPGGGTNVFRGIEAAVAELADAPVAARHIIVLTDGNSEGDHDEGIRRADQLRRSGITLSTISIGDSAADQLLAQLAHAGGGRFHRVTNAALARQLPEVLRRETESIRRAPVREGEPYDLVLLSQEGPMAGATALPRITGYGVVSDRGSPAIVTVRGPEGDAIVASWNRGLGRVMAFTGDPLGPWGIAWREWSGYGPLWRQAARWTARRPSDRDAVLAVEETAAGPRLQLTLRDAAGESIRGAVAQARWVTERGERGSVEFEQIGAGRFTAPLPLDHDALALITAHIGVQTGASNDDAADRTVTRVARAVWAGRSIGEWRRASADEVLLRRAADITHGRELALGTPTSLFARDGVRFPTWTRAIWQAFAILAAFLFLADVACRRLLHPRWAPVPASRPASSTSSNASSAASDTTDVAPSANADVTDRRLHRLQIAKRRASAR